jgi:hypothetical protein
MFTCVPRSLSRRRETPLAGDRYGLMTTMIASERLKFE